MGRRTATGADSRIEATQRWRDLQYSSSMDQRTRIGIFLLWVGAFLPIAASVTKTTEDVTAGVGPLDVLRGGGPVVMFVIALMVAPHIGPKRKLGFPEWSIILFITVAVASTFWSADARTTFLKCVPLVFSYACIIRLGKMYPSTKAAIAGVVGVSHILMLGTLAQWALIPAQAYSADVGDSVQRLGSLYPGISPNLLGVVALVALTGIVMQVGPRLTHSPGVAAVLCVIYIVMLFASRSRIVTAIAVAIVLVAGIVSMHRTHARAALGWFTAAATLTAGVIGAQSANLLADFADFLVRGQDTHAITSLTGRTVIWDRALEAWSQNPLVGYGYYAGHRLFLPSIDPLFRNYSNLDSTWIETLVNLGYLGLIPLVAFAVSALLRLVRADLPRPEKVVAVGIAVAVLALSFVNPTIQSPSSSVILFGVIVFACRATPGQGQKQVVQVPNAKLLARIS